MFLIARRQALAAAIPVIPQLGVEQAELMVLAGLSYTVSIIIISQFMWLSKFCRKVAPRQLYVTLALLSSPSIAFLSLDISVAGFVENFLITMGMVRAVHRDLIPEELTQATTLGLLWVVIVWTRAFKQVLLPLCKIWQRTSVYIRSRLQLPVEGVLPQVASSLMKLLPSGAMVVFRRGNLTLMQIPMMRPKYEAVVLAKPVIAIFKSF